MQKIPLDDCGPATPDSPCESPGLGYSAFARHYSRNHGCFLFLGVLRWFTSPGSPVHPMDSDARNECSHSLGFPIRKSPDHSLLAASRGLSQLTTSFFAFLRLGIHTHALSSLTITSTSHTHGTWLLPCPGFTRDKSWPTCRSQRERYFFGCLLVRQPPPMGSGHLVMPVNIQLSKISIASAISIPSQGLQ